MLYILKIKSETILPTYFLKLLHLLLSSQTLCSDFTTDVIGEAAFGVTSETVKTGDSLMRRITKEFASFNLHRGLCWSSIFFYPELVDVFR